MKTGKVAFLALSSSDSKVSIPDYSYLRAVASKYDGLWVTATDGKINHTAQVFNLSLPCSSNEYVSYGSLRDDVLSTFYKNQRDEFHTLLLYPNWLGISNRLTHHSDADLRSKHPNLLGIALMEILPMMRKEDIDIHVKEAVHEIAHNWIFYPGLYYGDGLGNHNNHFVASKNGLNGEYLGSCIMLGASVEWVDMDSDGKPDQFTFVEPSKLKWNYFCDWCEAQLGIIPQDEAGPLVRLENLTEEPLRTFKYVKFQELITDTGPISKIVSCVKEGCLFNLLLSFKSLCCKKCVS